MKIIQLNAWHFKYLHEMVDFLKQEKPDIINLQEVSSGKFNYCDPAVYHPFEYLKKELNMDGMFAPFSGFRDQDGSLSQSGNGFLTSLEIVDMGAIFEKSLPAYTEYSEKDEMIQTILLNDKSKYYNVFEEPKNVLWSVLKTAEGKYIRNLTSHFTVSYDCVETIQHIQQARSVIDYISGVKQMPTIFTGDLNIHDRSASVAKLSEVLEMVNTDTKNSLNKLIHPIFKYTDCEALRVDYIFQKGFKVLDYSVPDITVSDHLPVIAELELL
jgi:endonuclease/exonuclease/phosphatase family metal-dependent hydrolase